MLRVLLSKVRPVRLHDVQKLRDYGGHAAEVPGAELAAQMLREHLDIHIGALAAGIHLGDFGGEDEIGAARFRECGVGRERSRVALVIVRAVELDRVDEDAHGDGAALAARDFDQAAVAGVKCAHGRDQADGLPGAAEPHHRLAHAGDGVNELGAHAG